MKYDEDTLPGGLAVAYPVGSSNVFKTGNRRGYWVELYYNGKFVRTVDTSEIEIRDIEGYLRFLKKKADFHKKEAKKYLKIISEVKL